MWRTRAETAKGVSRGGLFVARRYFGIVTPRRTRTRRGVASTRGRARRTRCVLPRVDSAGSRDRAASHPALDRSNLKIDPPRDPFADPRDASLVGARAVGFRDGRRSKKTKKNKKKHRSKETPYRIVRMRASRVRGCIAVVDSLPRGAHPHRCAGSRQVPEGRLEPTKGVRSFVRSSKSRGGVRWRHGARTGTGSKS